MSALDTPVLLARQAWIDASHFHNLSDEDVLREVQERVSRHRAENSHEKPVVLLDLDSTLYEVGPRTHQILREWASTISEPEFARLSQTFQNLHPSAVGYSLRDTFHSAGLNVEEAHVKAAWDSAKDFWNRRFFTSRYLDFDHAYPGAAEFVQELYRLGAELIYLTGRDEPNMGDGTRARLKRDGFPWEVERTHLLMKAAPELDDLSHKTEAAHYVRKHGKLIASFENEPKNLAALWEIFPDAMHVFMDTVYSDHPTVAREGLYRLRKFTR